MRKILSLAFALSLLGGGAYAQTITKSLQGSQDPRGPVGADASSNMYFPNHINTYGNLGTTPSAVCTGPCGTLAGTDNAGSVVTSGTVAYITFGQAFNVTPYCTFQELAGSTAPTFTLTTTGINASTVVTAKTYDWLCFGY